MQLLCYSFYLMRSYSFYLMRCYSLYHIASPNSHACTGRPTWLLVLLGWMHWSEGGLRTRLIVLVLLLLFSIARILLLIFFLLPLLTTSDLLLSFRPSLSDARCVIK